MKNMIILIITFMIVSCDKNPTNSKSEYGFAIYFLKNEDLKIKDVFDKDIEDLKLASDPWLIDEDIRFYDWSDHCIYLKNDKEHLRKYLNYNDGWDEPYLWNKPYVVTANNKRCYMGYFNVFSSIKWPCPHIDVSIDILGFPKDVIHSQLVYIFTEDLRNNEDVKQTLLEHNLYRRGIKFSLDTTGFFIDYSKNKDTIYIEYTFKITNCDQDTLFVIDPDKMVRPLFFYFYNGLVLKNQENNEIIRSIDKSSIPEPYYYSWSPEWFTKLIPGQTMMRTIKQSYSYFSTGNYIMQATFDNPVLNFEKEVREIEEGRYWIGKSRTKVFVLSVNEDEKKRNFFIDN
ncbi:MAG: hypothetical protein JXQ65_04650 [Candidatus Marinimicrobia bacterium]|nr:hypothetical protein [Candidatus Neomarinimicrobiota bacterium]